MEIIAPHVPLFFAAAGGFLGWFLGMPNKLLFVLLAFVATDYLAGVVCAIKGKCLCSNTGFQGITEKVLLFAMVGIANLLDTQILKGTGALRTAVIFFYLSNEGISILEHAARLGLPVPERLKSVLLQLQSSGSNTSTESNP